MRFGILSPVRSGATADREWLKTFARLVEGLGFESIVLVEHAVIVSGYQSRYPYSSSGRMPLPDDCAIPDPIDVLGFLAAGTAQFAEYGSQLNDMSIRTGIAASTLGELKYAAEQSGASLEDVESGVRKAQKFTDPRV